MPLGVCVRLSLHGYSWHYVQNHCNVYIIMHDSCCDLISGPTPRACAAVLQGAVAAGMKVVVVPSMVGAQEEYKVTSDDGQADSSKAGGGKQRFSNVLHRYLRCQVSVNNQTHV